MKKFEITYYAPSRISGVEQRKNSRILVAESSKKAMLKFYKWSEEVIQKYNLDGLFYVLKMQEVSDEYAEQKIKSVQALSEKSAHAKAGDEFTDVPIDEQAGGGDTMSQAEIEALMAGGGSSEEESTPASDGGQETMSQDDIEALMNQQSESDDQGSDQDAESEDQEDDMTDENIDEIDVDTENNDDSIDETATGDEEIITEITDDPEKSDGDEGEKE